MGVVILGILGMLCTPLLNRWLGIEIGVWHKPLCQWLVKLAASRMPAEERVATEAEWLAVIEDTRSPTMQLLNAASYVWSVVQIRQAIAPRSASSWWLAVFANCFGAATTFGVVVSLAYFDDDVAKLHKIFADITSHPYWSALLLLVFSFAATYATYRLMELTERLRSRRSNRLDGN